MGMRQPVCFCLSPDFKESECHATPNADSYSARRHEKKQEPQSFVLVLERSITNERNRKFCYL